MPQLLAHSLVSSAAIAAAQTVIDGAKNVAGSARTRDEGTGIGPVSSTSCTNCSGLQ